MTWTLDIDHVAGIIDGDATIEPGLNAVRAANWQGKSSFVTAVETALGTATELTEGADSGRVHLETPERSVTVRLVRDGDTVRREGTPYLTDEYDVVRASLFACLDADNPVRRAVRRGENLADVLLRPLDFQNIDEQIADLRRERERVADELSQATEARKRLPSVQERVTRLEREIEELRERRTDVDDPASGGDDDSARQELSQARSARSEAEDRVEQLEGSIERLADRLDERRAELDALDVPAHDDVDARLEAAREDLAAVKRDAEVVQSLYSATELVLDENRLDLVTEVEREVAGDTVACWTCGGETTRAAIEERLDALGTRLGELRAATDRHRERVDELEARREQYRQVTSRRDDLEVEIRELEEQLADRRQSLADAQERLAAASERVETLTERVDETMATLSDIESEIKYREAELDDARGELETLEERAERVESLEAERDDLREEIEDLRTRKDRIERDAREAFDEAMTDIVARFETGFEAAHLTPDFDIVVARDGRETSLDALSEGERELVGFVAALAGWESFDAGDRLPLILVDSVGGLDDDNLHTLVDYLRDRAEYLVFTAYPEYAAFDGQEIDPTEWTVANEGSARAD
jgi:DNA repair exonuclease SbcCD ATPase subunit